jgi:serine protease Do
VTPTAAPTSGVVGTSAGSSPSPGASSEPAPADPFAAVVALVQRNSPAVVTITTEEPSGFGGNIEGVGSGMIVDPAGWILTNNHVIAGASSMSVALKDGRTFTGTTIASNPDADLAVIKVTATGLPHVTLGSSAALHAGQLMVAIGSPLGDFPGSVTSGILSATGRTVDIGNRRAPLHLTHLLQIDAPINPGNSGGPLFDAAGQVIGMITAVDAGGQGIAFAIPIDDAKPIIQRSIAGG